MEGARLRWKRTAMAVLLGFLPLAFLIPGAFALQCHSYTAIQFVSSGRISSGFTTGSSVSSVCSPSQNLCVEAQLMLRTEKTALLVTHRDCTSKGLKEGAGLTASHIGDLTADSNVRYCHSDLCNGELVDFNSSRVSEQDKASEANSSHQCYSGLTMDTKQDIQDRAMCGRSYSRCYGGKGFVAAGHLGLSFHIKTCQDPSCNVSESQSFGPIELKLWGSCCRGNFCNGVMAAPQSLADSTAAPTQLTTRLEEDTVTPRTDSPKPDIVSDVRNTSAVPEEVTATPDHERDITASTMAPNNPLYDNEENEDEALESPDYTYDTLNPRAANLGPPKASLPFGLLLVTLGIAILGIW